MGYVYSTQTSKSVISCYICSALQAECGIIVDSSSFRNKKVFWSVETDTCSARVLYGSLIQVENLAY